MHLTDEQLPSAARYVIDGGYLLHKLRWTKGSSINDILNAYVNLVQCKFQYTQIVIVFDGNIGCADVDCNITDVVTDDENEYFLDEDLYFVDEEVVSEETLDCE